MENPTKIEIEGLKTIHKLCKFGADHNMEGCSFTEIVERMFYELQQAQKVAVPEGFVLVPKTNSDKGIESMAMRYRHDFPLLDADYQEGIKSQMRQLYEEAVGLGFYSHKAQEQVG